MTHNGLFYHENLTSMLYYLLFVAVFAFAAANILFELALTRPKLIPTVPFVGSTDGERSLRKARMRFRTHGADMLQEGYNMVR